MVHAEDERTTENIPMMRVLSLSCWWDVSMEGIVPDIARGRVCAIGARGGDANDEEELG